MTVLAGDPREAPIALADPRAVAGADPWGDDLQLALYVALELGFRGFAGVDDAWELHPPPSVPSTSSGSPSAPRSRPRSGRSTPAARGRPRPVRWP